MAHGILPRLLLVALVLLALPWLAAEFIASMERFLRQTQQEQAAATARVVAAALSDRPALFERSGGETNVEDEERRRIVALFAAADAEAAASLGAAYAPSEEIERLLHIMGRRATRMWVIDARSRVRGLSGTLRDTRAAEPMSRWLRPIANLVAPPPRLEAGDESRPVRSQIDRALIGISSTHWRGTRDRDVAILSAAQPIFVGDDIVGAVVLEETTLATQILKQSALENLLAVTLAVVGAALIVLLAFAARLAARVRRLHAQAEAAIDPQGRVRGTITPSKARDEIGDLSRTMAAVHSRLREYNAYLEALAGRLTHELRTPVAVVRSSLDNLRQQALPEEARVYVERANEGVGRLSRLISRLSEATRLERLMETAERERFDLGAVVASCIAGYQSAYAPRRFDYAAPGVPVVVDGVPDAFAQMLDKLVENANDFAPPDTAIRVQLARRGAMAQLAVENDGPPLPEEARARLFESMVTMREGERAGAHLGLGLYIVRLVAEFHGGGVDARSTSGAGGVRFTVEVPAVT